MTPPRAKSAAKRSHVSSLEKAGENATDVGGTREEPLDACKRLWMVPRQTIEGSMLVAKQEVGIVDDPLDVPHEVVMKPVELEEVRLR